MAKGCFRVARDSEIIVAIFGDIYISGLPTISLVHNCSGSVPRFFAFIRFGIVAGQNLQISWQGKSPSLAFRRSRSGWEIDLRYYGAPLTTDLTFD